ncbi:MAG: hypothetical protein ACKOQ6_10365 [Bacteroidota bacterium]
MLRTYRTLLLASIAASVISTASSWFFYSSWNEVEDGHTELMKKNSELTATYSLLETAFDSTSRELSIMRDPNYRSIPMYEGSETRKEMCRIWWNPYNRKTFFDPLSLPTLPGDSVYQLWCSSNDNVWLVSTFGGDATGGKLLNAGLVAVADNWTLRPCSKTDSMAPDRKSFVYSSFR